MYFFFASPSLKFISNTFSANCGPDLKQMKFGEVFLLLCLLLENAIKCAFQTFFEKSCMQQTWALKCKHTMQHLQKYHAGNLCFEFFVQLFIYFMAFFNMKKRHTDIDVEHEFLDVDIEIYFQGRASVKLHVLQPFFTYIVDI